MKTYKSIDKTAQIKYDKKISVQTIQHEDSIIVSLSKIHSYDYFTDIEIEASRNCVTINKTEDTDETNSIQTLIKLTGFHEGMLQQTLQVDYWTLTCMVKGGVLTVVVEEE